MPNKSSPVKSKSVIVAGGISVFSLVYKIIDAAGNAEFLLQKIGVSEDVAKILGSSRGIDALLALSLLALIIIFFYKANRYFSDYELALNAGKPSEVKQSYEAPKPDLTPQKESPEAVIKAALAKPQKTKPVLELLGTRCIKVERDNENIISLSSVGTEKAFLMEFRLASQPNSESAISIRTTINFRNINNISHRVRDGVWMEGLSDADNRFVFSRGDERSLILALINNKGHLITYEHNTVNLETNDQILVPKLYLVEGQEFQVEIQFIGEVYSDLVLHQVFSFQFFVAAKPKVILIKNESKI